MTLKLKVGKRYVRRDGGVTDPLIENDSGHFILRDTNFNLTYKSNGQYNYGTASPADLISEYKPAKPEWRVVIPCPSRDGARLMAAFLKEKNPSTKITVEKSS